MAARVGLAPTPNGLTGRRATFTLPGNTELALPAGVAPASVRLEDERLVYFGHGSILKWSEQQDFHLRPPGPKPGALKTELRSEKMADPKGLAPSAFPQTTGCSGYLSYGSERWWEVLVMLQSSLPTVVKDTGFTGRQPEHLPKW